MTNFPDFPDFPDFNDFVEENSIILNDINNPSNSPQVSLTVSTFEDQNDGSSLSGLSLRDAILQAQADPSQEYIIYLGAGTYNLYIQGNEDSLFGSDPLLPGDIDDLVIRTGDLDIDNNITIIGINPSQTIINAADLGDRVFDVREGGNLTLNNVTIQGGTAINTEETNGNIGGGIRVNENANAIVNNSVIKNNATETTGIDDSNGGGIANLGTMRLNNSLVSENLSGDDAGGIYNTGILIIDSSTIAGNFANAAAFEDIEAGGAGIYTLGGTLIMTNSTISGNITGDAGGGILSEGSTTFIVNSTIANNTAQIGSGILSVNPTDDIGVILQNSIVADNKGSADIEGFFAPNSANNLIGDGNGILLNGVNGNITGDIFNPLDPQLTPLQDNFGPTPTHALEEGSPAINGGNNDLAVQPGFDPEPLTTDQRGLNRIIDGTVDIGSTEFGNTENSSYDSLLNSGLADTPGLVYRFYNPNSQGHFFTTNETERDTILANSDWGYIFESYGFLASEIPGNNLIPVYRFYNPFSQGHFFTTSEAEKNTVLANPDWGYQEEGIGFYAYGSSVNGSLPVYRFYNPFSQGHFFTISEAEKDNILTNPSWGYSFEGIGFYANTV
jgi:hypothetical protein